MLIVRLLAIGAALLLARCVEPQRVVKFHAPVRANDPIDSVVRALAANGYQAASVDRATGIVQTEWQDTGFGYGFIQDEKATIHRRYVAIVTRSEAGCDVLLRMDAKRCGPPRATVISTQTTNPGGPSVSVGVDGVNLSAGGAPTTTVSQIQTSAPCEQMQGMVESHQEDLDRLGQELKSSLGG